jgi:uncharacterized iron-regulated membrane protein
MFWVTSFGPHLSSSCVAHLYSKSFINSQDAVRYKVYCILLYLHKKLVVKIFFRRIHLYLAFAAGLIITVTCFTGAILVFEDELQHTFYKDRYFAKEDAGQQLPVDSLIKAVKQKVPSAKILGVKIYTDPKRNIEIAYSDKKAKEDKPATKEKSPKDKNAGQRPQQEGNRIIAFVNPYTANVVELYNFKESFFYSTLSLHRWLLSGDVGKLIVGISTLLFLFILITGIILWWPKTRNILRQRLKVKWNAGWKRINHDFHIVLGFYSSIFLFIFAFTALAWSFQWFNDGIYTVTHSSKEQPKPPVSVYDSSAKKVSVDSVYQTSIKTVQDVHYYNINLPKDSIGVFAVNVLSKHAAHESASDNYYFNQYSAQLIGTLKFSDKNLGQRVRSTFKPVHVSSIYGTTSKVIGLLVCLLGTVFPISGYIMWFNRTRKKRLPNK